MADNIFKQSDDNQIHSAGNKTESEMIIDLLKNDEMSIVLENQNNSNRLWYKYGRITVYKPSNKYDENNIDFDNLKDAIEEFLK